MKSQNTIDVFGLPESLLDRRSLVWWGNLLMLAIETTMFALLVAAYFYVIPNFTPWPPPQSNLSIAIIHTAPGLRLPTINLAVILLSCVPMLVADRLALHRHYHGVLPGVLLTIVLGGVAIWLRWGEFSALQFRWDDNAYASIVWTTLGLHLLHLIIGTLENVIMTTWMFCHGLDDKHARDVRVTAVYWYWIAGIWVVLYGIIFLGPRYF